MADVKGRRLAVMQALGLLVGGYALLCAVVFLLQRRLIYFPDASDPAPPAGVVAEEWNLKTADGESLRAWFLPVEDARGALLFCHGNAGNRAHRLHSARFFQDLGLSVLLFDYRGYGGSTGHPSEAGLVQDAVAAHEALCDRGFSADEIVLYGESLGGAVAIQLASRRPARLLIVEATFSSMADMGVATYPWLPVRWLLCDRYESARVVAELTLPKIFLHSPGDELVPFELGRALFESAAEPKQLFTTRGGHNDGGIVLCPDLAAPFREAFEAAWRQPR